MYVALNYTIDMITDKVIRKEIILSESKLTNVCNFIEKGVNDNIKFAVLSNRTLYMQCSIVEAIEFIKFVSTGEFIIQNNCVSKLNTYKEYQMYEN